MTSSIVRQTTLRTFFGLKESPPKDTPGRSRAYFKRLTRPPSDALPAQKRILGTSFVMDAFDYGLIPDCHYYFLRFLHVP